MRAKSETTGIFAKAHDGAQPSGLRLTLQPFFQELISRYCCHTSTSLVECVDFRAVVCASMERIKVDNSVGPWAVACDPESCESLFDVLFAEALTAPRTDLAPHEDQLWAATSGAIAATLSEPTTESLNATVVAAIAKWLERCSNVMREVHPRAMEITALRADGMSDREIADELGLGLRLVSRLVWEMQLAWESATQKGAIRC